MREKLSWTDRGRSELLNLVKCFLVKLVNLEGLEVEKRVLKLMKQYSFGTLFKLINIGASKV